MATAAAPNTGTVCIVPSVPAGYAATAQPSSAEPPAKIIIDAPMAEPLSRGVVFVQYRVGNLRVAPVVGNAALGVSPRVGHVHVTVHKAQWH